VLLVSFRNLIVLPNKNITWCLYFCCTTCVQGFEFLYIYSNCMCTWKLILSACPLGRYMSDCSAHCNCARMAQCDLSTGMCPNKLCQPLYGGKQCDQSKKNILKFLNNSYDGIICFWLTNTLLSLIVVFFFLSSILSIKRIEKT